MTDDTQTVDMKVTIERRPERVTDVAILTLKRQGVHARHRKTLIDNGVQSTPCTPCQFRNRMYTLQGIYTTRKPCRMARQTADMKGRIGYDTDQLSRAARS